MVNDIFETQQTMTLLETIALIGEINTNQFCIILNRIYKKHL